MNFNLRTLTTIFAAFVLNVSMMNIANAENIKKSQSKKAQNTTQVNSNNWTWKDEPTSIYGIKLAQPLHKSIPLACPTKFEYGRTGVDNDAVKAMPLSQPCHFYEDSGSGRHNITAYVRGMDSSRFVLIVHTDTGLIDGNIRLVEGVVRKTEYSDFFRTITAKYGQPQEKASTPMVLASGESEKVEEAIWRGKSVTLYTTSHNRDVSCCGKFLIEVKNINEMSKSEKEKADKENAERM